MLSSTSFSFSDPETDPTTAEALERRAIFHSYVESFYDCLGDSQLSYKALEYGLKGFHYLADQKKFANEKYLTIVDFSLPSSAERLYVIDIEQHKIVHKSLVAHGMKTGRLYAEEFSNENNSHMSSLGFFSTGRVYNGKHKKSVKLHGLERGFNDNVYDRGVVIHSAEYATEEFMRGNGNVLGRSQGCPAVPYKGYEQTVSLIKDGTCFFIYCPQRNYLRKSKVLNNSKAYDHFMEAYNS